jgi:acetolactate synthase-1/2/3 large subunit
MTIDLYSFVTELNRLSSPDDIICPSASGYGTLITLQSWRLKPGQRFTTNFVFGQMGAGLSTAIGATLATGKRVLLIEGDGGFQLNVQELAVVRDRKLPIMIFVINNNGYASIRTMQDNRFNGHHVACDESSGLSLISPNQEQDEYGEFLGIPVIAPVETTRLIEYVFEHELPVIAEVYADPNQQYRHKLKSQLVDGKWQWQKLEEIE